MNALVVFDDVGAEYSSDAVILEAVTASFEESAVHSITGPSGCGKSTMLYVAGLMLRARRGTLEVCGEDHTASGDRQRAKARSRHIGFVFQDALLEPSTTVEENIFEGVPFDQSIRPVRSRAHDLAEQFGLSTLMHQRAARLSGGQAQRVGLVRAMLKDPAVMLADEPTGNLDDSTASTVLDALFEFGRRPAHTTIIVTHDVRIASRTDTTTVLGASDVERPVPGTSERTSSTPSC